MSVSLSLQDSHCEQMFWNAENVGGQTEKSENSETFWNY